MAAPFAEFAGNKRLLWIAQEWLRYSDELADWAMERLVNRRDVWSQYTIKPDGEVGVVMLPIPERRKLGTDMVTLHKLQRHFAARSVAHLIGLFSISDINTCKWFVIDVDLHDESVANAGEIAEANLTACKTWAEKLREQFFDPCIIDSNGVGGYHVWVLLDDEYPLADTFDFVSDLRDDWASFGLPRKPEVFPPKRHVEPGHLPYGLRVPGRHHLRAHYSRVWNWESTGGNQWLEGSDAIEALLALRPAPLPATTKTQKEADAQQVVQKPEVTKRKPRVCVDLDGVLAEYDGWQGAEKIGKPLPGALEFMRSLAEIAEIIIFTTRCSIDKGQKSTGRNSPGRAKIRVIDWLEKNKFPFTDVYVGQGKPLAAAFIDDRAVNCSPQTDPKAFVKTLESTRELLKPRKKSPRQNP